MVGEATNEKQEGSGGPMRPKPQEGLAASSSSSSSVHLPAFSTSPVSLAPSLALDILINSHPVTMASSLRVGSSALRASMAAPSAPLRQATYTAARAYSSKSAVRCS